MKKLLLALAVLPALLACSGNDGGVGKPVKSVLKENEELYVYTQKNSDTYRLNGYSFIHSLGNTLRFAEITYTYWPENNAIDVRADNYLIKYRGFLVSFDVIVNCADGNE